MRTTVTLDEDVAVRLEREMRRSGKSCKQALDDALRAGLALRGSAAAAPFGVEARALGLHPGLVSAAAGLTQTPAGVGLLAGRPALATVRVPFPGCYGNGVPRNRRPPGRSPCSLGSAR